MEEKFIIDEEKHIEILDAFLGDADLMVAVNECKTFEEGYELVAQKKNLPSQWIFCDRL
ncbi:MAG: hypothetical protein PWP20_1606 [Eubacteriaceae bacterium]|nr:hypothetical protein [Eubacteriaceae bacterium]